MVAQEREYLKYKVGSWKKYRRAVKRKIKDRDEEEEIPTGVVFIQHTLHSRLAKNIRERLNKLEESSGKLKIKIVERGGNKLTDLLHKSNAWSELDCDREDCLICKTENSKKGSCRRRNILYETYCITCQRMHGEENVKFNSNECKLDGENQLQANSKPYRELDGKNQLQINPKYEISSTEIDGLDGENQSPENPKVLVVSKFTSSTLSMDELEGINQLQKNPEVQNKLDGENQLPVNPKFINISSELAGENQSQKTLY